ncbi:MAG: membrane protein insertion efficiency factor YidD [Ignavibacteriales bacterium]|nr:membrane protein insertion efficiency factor YidD [Ignavibacteriales bacterium]
MYRFFLCLLIFVAAHNAAAQTGTVKWGKVNKSYGVNPTEHPHENFTVSFKKPSDILVKPLFAVYQYFISEPDGSRCPFSPSCSSFFLQATEQVSFPAALFLTADRLTRDANFINRGKLYHLDKATNKLLDPVSKYKNAPQGSK